jgi:hypothetical protein
VAVPLFVTIIPAARVVDPVMETRLPEVMVVFAFTAKLPEKLSRALVEKVVAPLMETAPAIVTAELLAKVAEFVKVTLPEPALEKEPRLETPALNSTGELFAQLYVAPDAILNKPTYVSFPVLLASVSDPLATVVVPLHVKFPAPKASDPVIVVFPATAIAPVAAPTESVPATERFPLVESVFVPDMKSDLPALIVTSIADADTLTVTGPLITTDFVDVGTTPPTQVPVAFQLPPVVVLVIIWA